MTNSTDIVSKLRFLVSLDEPRNGGPYGGHAASEFVKTASQAADLIQSQQALIEEMREALMAAKELADVMEGLSGGRSDDEWIWAAQAKINKALSQKDQIDG